MLDPHLKCWRYLSLVDIQFVGLMFLREIRSYGGSNVGTSQANRQVHIVQLKCCQDTRPETPLQRALEQHAELRQQLIAAGYSASNIHIVPILIGVSGTIYKQHTLDSLHKLGVTRANARRCASKLHEQAIKCMHSIVTTRHALAHSAAHPRPQPRPP